MSPHSVGEHLTANGDGGVPPHRVGEHLTAANGDGGVPTLNGDALHGSPSPHGLSNGTAHGVVHTSAVNGTRAHGERASAADARLGGDGGTGPYDLVCVGFGPASLAVAVALHDALEAGALATAPRVLFLEKQARFAWHAGMLLPGAKMQISFVKDLATLRNPRSHFTFLNYLHAQDRLVEFTNLSTFLPARVEYEDYLRWCADHFRDVTRYRNEVLSVSPVRGGGGDAKASRFAVTSRDLDSGATTTYEARHVLIALGGQPSIPKCLPAGHPRVIHSSQYAQAVPQILRDRDAPYRVAVVGAGQSAAEIFHNVQTLYPNARTFLVMRSEFLKPSDDSPFVNSIFNPAFIDELYPRPSAHRRRLITEARATNYGVVRLELIERLYERMYDQRRELGANEQKWPHRILGRRQVLKAEEVDGGRLRLQLCAWPPAGDAALDGPAVAAEALDVDLVVAATGYRRTAHVDLLRDAWPLLPEVAEDDAERRSSDGYDRWLVPAPERAEGPAAKQRVLEVGRDYGVRFASGAVAPDAGVWLQGCCEGTHGLSDTLLSVLATRSGEIVHSIFGTP